MRIAMIGQKHFGSREGGVEVVVTELARRLAELGNEVTCYDRASDDVMTGAHADKKVRIIDGVRVVPVSTINRRGLAAASSSFSATRLAIKDHPDIIHFHAEGPCVPLRLANRAGIPTVATIHGLNWQQAKWGGLASRYIKLGEKTAARYADRVIVLSPSTQEYFKRTYGRKCVYIPNGADVHTKVEASEIVRRWGLTSGSYLLFLGRIVPGKGLGYLIRAFMRLETDKRLVVAGGSSETSDYYQAIRQLASGDKRILFTGFVRGRVLSELYSNAYLFILPSDSEGMPLSLLEAMSYGCCCVTSDIPECVNVLGHTGFVFPKGSVTCLHNQLKELIAKPEQCRITGVQARERVSAQYTWDQMVSRTIEVYQEAIHCHQRMSN